MCRQASSQVKVSTYKKNFVEGRKNYQSFDFVVDAIRRREFGILKSSLQGWVDSRKCISDETLFSQARICMVRCSLVWLKHHWDPSTNIKWFNSTLLRGRKGPTKKFRTLSEWVKNEIQQHGEIQVKDVREKASLLVDSSLSKYKKFKKVGDRIKILLKLKSEGEKG